MDTYLTFLETFAIDCVMEKKRALRRALVTWPVDQCHFNLVAEHPLMSPIR